MHCTLLCPNIHVWTLSGRCPGTVHEPMNLLCNQCSVNSLKRSFARLKKCSADTLSLRLPQATTCVDICVMCFNHTFNPRVCMIVWWYWMVLVYLINGDHNAIMGIFAFRSLHKRRSFSSIISLTSPQHHEAMGARCPLSSG